MSNKTAKSKSKIIGNRSLLGWGYSNTPTGTDAWSIKLPTYPYHTGTIRQVLAAITGDRTYQSERNSALTAELWFIRIRGQWRPITNDGFYWLHAIQAGEKIKVDYQ